MVDGWSMFLYYPEMPLADVFINEGEMGSTWLSVP